MIQIYLVVGHPVIIIILMYGNVFSDGNPKHCQDNWGYPVIIIYLVIATLNISNQESWPPCNYKAQIHGNVFSDYNPKQYICNKVGHPAMIITQISGNLLTDSNP